MEIDVDEPATSHDTYPLEVEAELPAEIAPSCPHAQLPRSECVLLTGATGFVGAHLVESLRRADQQVLCLVRARDEAQGRQRLETVLRKYRLPALNGSVTVVLGDLEAPRWGLTERAFARIAEQVEVVVHNGARVHLDQSYATLRASNVGGTLEALRLACTGGPKRMVHISGMSVFRSAPSMVENAPAPRPVRRFGGYFDTKWVSERLVWRALERGLDARVVRLGWISGHSQYATIAEGDAMTIFLRACIRLGLAPRLSGGGIDCTPVDVAARAVAHVALSADWREPGCNLWATHHLPEDALWRLVRERGHVVQLVSAREWGEALSRRFPLLAAAAGSVNEDWNFPPKQNSNGRALMHHAADELTTDKLLDLYVTSWLRPRAAS